MESADPARRDADRPGAAVLKQAHEAESRDAQVRAMFAGLSSKTRRTLWGRAEAEVRGEFAQVWGNLGFADRQLPEAAVWAVLAAMLPSREPTGSGRPPSGDRATGPSAPLPSPAMPDAQRLVAWVRADHGIDVCQRARGRALAAARRRVWFILATWGVSVRAMAELCGIDHAAVVRGLEMIRGSRAEQAEAWAARFERLRQALAP